MAPDFNYWDYHSIVDANSPDKIMPGIPADDYETRSRTGDPISASEMHSRLWVLWSSFFKVPIGKNTALHDILEIPLDTIPQPRTVNIDDEIGIHFVPMFWRGPLPIGVSHPIREGRRQGRHWLYWGAAWLSSMDANTVFFLKISGNEELNQRFITFLSTITWSSNSPYADSHIPRRRAVTVIPYSLPNPQDHFLPDSTAWTVVNAFAELLLNPSAFRQEPTDAHANYLDFISLPKLKPLMKQKFIAYQAMRLARAPPPVIREARREQEELEVGADVEENGGRALRDYERGVCFACNERFPPGRQQSDPQNLLHQCGICQLAFHQNCQLQGRRAIEPYEARGHQTWLCSSCKDRAPGFRPRSRRANQQTQRRAQQPQSNAHARLGQEPQCDYCGGLIRANECSIPCHQQECPKVFHTRCAMKTEGHKDSDIEKRKRVIEMPRRALVNPDDRAIENYYNVDFECPLHRNQRRNAWIQNRMPQAPLPIRPYQNHGFQRTCDRCGAAQLFPWEFTDNRICCGTLTNGVHFATEQHEIPPMLRHLHNKFPQALPRYSRLINSMVSIASVACLQLVRAGSSLVSRVTGGVSQNINATTLTPEGHLESVGVIAHFGISDRGPRQNPLIGNVLSYVFPEPSHREVASLTMRIGNKSVRIPAMTVEFIQECRKIFRNENPFFQQIVARMDVDQTLINTGNYDDQSVIGMLGANRVDRNAIPAVGWDPTTFHFPTPIALNTTAVVFSINNDTTYRPMTAGRLRGNNTVTFDHNHPCYDAFLYSLLDLYGRVSYCAGKDVSPEIFRSPGQTLYQRRERISVSWMKHLRAKILQLPIHRLCPDVTDQLVLDRVSMHYQIDARSREFFVRQHTHIPQNTEERPVRQVFDPIRHLHLVHHTVRGSMQERTYHVEQGCALVREFGHPTLFITITANEKWPEFTSAMIPETKWWQNMGTLCRVFKKKLDTLVEGLHEGTYFGHKAIYVQYKVEFQKRGKPHAHILAKLEDCDDLLPEQVNKMTTAELPRCPNVASYENENAQCTQADCSMCKLRKQVQQYMMHQHRPDRCAKKKPKRQNDTNPEPIVVDSERCQLGFPFPPQLETTFGPAGRWAYERSPVSGWIVPYSPQLISEFDCHINTEVSAGTRSVFYLQKYFAKVHDTVCAKVNFQPGSTQQAQLKQFFQLRYLCIAEAYWQLFGFPFVYYSPKVTSIYVNPRQNVQEQLDLFDPGMENDGEAGPAVEAGLTTNLQNYFCRPEHAVALTIVEFFSNFGVRKMTAAEIAEGDHPDNLIGSYREYRLVKKQESHVVCFRYKSLKDKERFCFSLLLENVACRSKTALRKVNGQLSPTYEQACKDRKLFDEDAGGLYRRLFLELDLHQLPLENFLMASKMFLLDNPELFLDFFERQKMFTFLVNPGDRWSRGQPLEEAELFPIALAHLARFCYKHNLLLKDMIEKINPTHPLLAKLDVVMNHAERIQCLRTQFDYSDVDIPRQSDGGGLSEEQRYALGQIQNEFDAWEAHQKGTGPDFGWAHLHYINGMAGTGKTTLLRDILSYFRGKGYNVASSAYTGIAALEIPKAQTCHSLYGIPINIDESKLADAETVDAGLEDHLAQRERGVVLLGHSAQTKVEVLQDIQVHIIDEVSLISWQQLEHIERILHAAAVEGGHRTQARPFGGAFIVFAGDFHQTTPILNKPSQETRKNDKSMNELVLNATILRHVAFQTAEKYQLTHPHRFVGPSVHAFKPFATKVAKATTGANYDPTREDCCAHFSIPLKEFPEFYTRNIFYSLADAVKTLPPERRADPLQMMAPHHRAVQHFNDMTIKENVRQGRIGELKYSTATYADAKPLRDLNYYDPSMMPGLIRFESVDLPREPPHSLPLAVGMPIMLLRNISVEDGMTNGAIFVITAIYATYFTARNFRRPDEIRHIHRMRMTMTCGIWEFSREQYPVRPAYAITINKSQGKTLSGPTILYLQEECFAHGQLYVALTRLRHPEELKVIVKARSKPEDVAVTNYVLTDVLRAAGLLDVQTEAP